MMRKWLGMLLALLLVLIAPAALAKTITVDAADYDVEEGGWYDTMEEVAIYLTFFEELPDNYLTKKEAQNLGWESRKGNLWDVAYGCSIGGDKFGNYEKLLPDKKGRKWTECDIDFEGDYRNGERIVFSNDGLIYYTDDHYESFDKIEVVWSDEEEANTNSGYSYSDPAAESDFGSLFGEGELDALIDWLFSE
ncbi:MAG: ribonuclease [Clostridia bacterium]|nr:ribonuclease [Clostridia bacterium]